MVLDAQYTLEGARSNHPRVFGYNFSDKNDVKIYTKEGKLLQEVLPELNKFIVNHDTSLRRYSHVEGNDVLLSEELYGWEFDDCIILHEAGHILLKEREKEDYDKFDLVRSRYLDHSVDIGPEEEFALYQEYGFEWMRNEFEAWKIMEKYRHELKISKETYDAARDLTLSGYYLHYLNDMRYYASRVRDRSEKIKFFDPMMGKAYDGTYTYEELIKCFGNSEYIRALNDRRQEILDRL